VQGRIEIKSEHIDDMILLRSDGTPTYMLAVVVDDIDMQITHIIRGDDHLTNASRQVALYNAIGAEVPIMAHIPMIHGEDGTKLSKRHGALGVDEYEKMGYLSDALFNYLLRLGWSHGDEEIISREQAIEWFDFDRVGKSPSRIDFDKLNNINSYYIRHSSDEDLLKIILPKLKEEYNITERDEQNVVSAMESIKQRSQVIGDLILLSSIYISSRKVEISNENFALINKEIVVKARDFLEKMNENDFNKQFVESSLKCFAKSEGLKIGDVMKSVRICLTGEINSPSVFEIIAIIGKKETLNRIDAVLFA
jgi:glutamyl-tRNA synthetase